MRPSREQLCISAHRMHEFHVSPFRYILWQRCLPLSLERALLEWFDNNAPWQLVTTDFYEQYEFSMFDAALPDGLSQLISLKNLSVLREEISEIFKVNLDERIKFVAHKLIPGQRIGIHNDYLTGEETHRFIIQVNRGLLDEDGGFLMLFNKFDPEDIHRIIRPISGSAIGFEISEKSNHAVSKVYRGKRFTLVYSFFAKPCVRSNCRRI